MDKCKKQSDIDITASGDCGKCSELDLIRRLSEIRSHYNCFNEKERKVYHTLSEAIEALKEQRTGEWILSFDGYENTWICSECGVEYVLYDGTIAEQHYCPNCGSHMENGGQDD